MTLEQLFGLNLDFHINLHISTSTNLNVNICICFNHDFGLSSYIDLLIGHWLFKLYLEIGASPNFDIRLIYKHILALFQFNHHFDVCLSSTKPLCLTPGATTANHENNHQEEH